MSQTEVDRFVCDMKTNTELQAEVKAKGGAIAEIIKIAIARGYSVAAEEVRVRMAFQKPVLTEEEEDLGHVAGELRRNVGEKAGS
jgi:predicted ribosomally synthesized peptide with nif11-like leader